MGWRVSVFHSRVRRVLPLAAFRPRLCLRLRHLGLAVLRSGLAGLPVHGLVALLVGSCQSGLVSFFDEGADGDEGGQVSREGCAASLDSNLTGNDLTTD